MTTLTGHLTATEKKAIKAILAAGLMAGKVNRKTYFINSENGIYTVSITENITNWCETSPRQTANKHTFTL